MFTALVFGTICGLVGVLFALILMVCVSTVFLWPLMLDLGVIALIIWLLCRKRK